MNIFLVFVIIIAVLVMAIVVLSAILKRAKTKLSASLETNLSQKKNLEELVSNTKEINKNKASKAKIEKEIKEAKTDEEVKTIINSIVDGNNERVQKSASSKSSSASKARKAGAKNS